MEKTEPAGKSDSWVLGVERSAQPAFRRKAEEKEATDEARCVHVRAQCTSVKRRANYFGSKFLFLAFLCTKNYLLTYDESVA